MSRSNLMTNEDYRTILEKKYTFRIDGKKYIFFKKHFEREQHVYGKALIVKLYHRHYPDLLVEYEVDNRYKPDVVALDPHGVPRFWAECLVVKSEKIKRLLSKYRKTHFVFVRADRKLDAFIQIVERYKKKSHHQGLVEVITLPEDFQAFISPDNDLLIRPRDCDRVQMR